MTRTRIIRFLTAMMLTISAGAPAAFAQTPRGAAAPSPSAAGAEQPDAQRTKQDLQSLFERYPPNLRGTLALDPSLLGNASYLAPYPALASFLSAHPEVARNPSFYVGQESAPNFNRDPAMEMWRDMLERLSIFAGFAMAIGVLVWLIRTLVDYRRWSRLAKVQAEVHTKILDRFTANDDLVAYVHSPAGARFLQSSPIMLDAGPRSLGAPLGRILWSIQGGLVLIAGGIGLEVVSQRITDRAAEPLHALGVLGIALGLGFVVSAIISYVISHRLGLIERSPASRTEVPGTGV